MSLEQQQQLDSFLNFLIKQHVIDNSQDSESLSKYINLYDQFNDQNDQDSESGCNITQSLNGDDDSQIMFETKSIFTLADFLKSLTANEYYDIAQKLYNQWQQQESKSHIQSLIKAIKIKDKVIQYDLQTAFSNWKQVYQFSNILEENQKLREYIYQLQKENDSLQNEKNILELQTKKRNQISINQIQPLRSARRQPSTSDTNRSQTRQQTTTSQLGQSIHAAYLPYNNDGSTPIYERLHKESYKKGQKQVINDVIKQHEELKDCTFKPNLSQNNGNFLSNQSSTPSSQSARRMIPSQQNQREDPFLYDRLSKSTKKFNPELMQLQKEQEEMKDCTFQPVTNHKSKQMAERNCNDYQNKEQFYDRLYKEAETKDKFKKSLQTIRDHAEVNSCTFQPELISSKSNNRSQIFSVRKQSTEKQQEETFNRLHSEHEQKQRSLIKIENDYEQKFKESHPFQPTRIAKQKDNKLCNRQETSQQRTARLYDEWKERERKIQEKRDELIKEEQKLCQLTLQTNNKKNKRQSIDNSMNPYVDQQLHTNNNLFNSNNTQDNQSTIMNTHQSSHSQQSNQSGAHERLYGQGKEKSRKQEELRDKVYREQGYSFAPQTNNSTKYHVDKNVFDRNREFIERKENNIKEMQQQHMCEFKPQRITAQSKLAKAYERDQDNSNIENLGDKLYQQMAVIEQKKEKQRQEYSIDKNCTFKPQLARKTDQILRESSSNRTMNGSTLTKSSASLQSQQKYENRQPFSVRNI